jgi:succinate dehydrogenase/fumarate reductase flavoprotein subunit
VEVLQVLGQAHDAGAQVLIISKGKKQDPHTVVARRGINAALGTMDPEDSWMMHATDTLREGEFLADYERVETLCKNAPDAITELVNWGARFHREKDGRLTQRFFRAHTYRRTILRRLDWLFYIQGIVSQNITYHKLLNHIMYAFFANGLIIYS